MNKLVKTDRYQITELIFLCNIIFMPFIVSFLDIFFPLPSFVSILAIYLIAYIVFFIVKVINNRIEFHSLFNSFLKILIWTALFWVILSSIINQKFEQNFIVYLSFFCIIFNASSVEKKYLKDIVWFIILTITTCAVMSILDSCQEFTPGFFEESCRFAAQFLHPNHSGYVTVIATILSVYLFANEKQFDKKFLLLSCFFILSIFMFLNCSYGSLLSILITLFCLTIFNWIKYKKFPIANASFLVSYLAIGLCIEFIPYLANFKLNEHGFFVETIAVIDNLFGTNLLSNIGIESIPGSDGWGRKNAVLLALENLKSHFLFGNGADCATTIGPHNEFLCLSLNFGILVGIIYHICFFVIFIKNIKQKNISPYKLALTFAMLGYSISGLVGSLICRTFPYFLIISVLANRNFLEETKEKKFNFIQTFIPKKLKKSI